MVSEGWDNCHLIVVYGAGSPWKEPTTHGRRHSCYRWLVCEIRPGWGRGVDLPASHHIPPYSVVRFPLFRVVQDNCSQTIYFCARGAIGGCSHLKQSTSLRWCFLPECGGWDQSEALRAPFGAFYFRLVSLSAGDVKLDLSCFHSRVLVYFVFPKHFIRWRKSRGECVTGMDLNVRQKERV